MRPKRRLRGETYAISNTGPPISAFQSNSFSLLTQIFIKIQVPTACVTELIRHGWGDEMKSASSRLIITELTSIEERRAFSIAEQIAKHPDTNDSIAENHFGEAQAIVLALRPEHQSDLLLLDELAARAIAKRIGLKLSGFPGALLSAVKFDLISAEELKTRLELCRQQGTHYGVNFIEQVYEFAIKIRRKQ